jgi:predicted membrane-bound mannosyltransferase
VRARAAAPGDRAPAPVRREEEPVAPPGRSWLTVETGAYLLIFIAALITRFWDLGIKGLHHDESLHAVYSHHYYTGLGYVHSPMMHGPLQFHEINAFYTLFGATNDTARYAAAVCGILVVMSPLFLRRQMGRWAALIASFLFLISPSIMYFSRMAREDAISAATEAILIVGLWRFISERRPWDFYLACAGFTLMFTIKETSYIIAAIFGVFLIGLFAWQMGRWLFLTLAGYGVAAAAAGLWALRTGPPIPTIANQDPTSADISNFVGLSGNGLIQHPLVQIELVLFVLFAAVWGYLLWDQRRRILDAVGYETVAPAPRRRGLARRGAATNGDEEMGLETVEFGPNGHETAGNGRGNGAAGAAFDAEHNGVPVDVEPEYNAPRDPGLLLRYQPGSLPYAVGALLRDQSVLWTGLAIVAVIYAGFYTTLFSNLPGLLTGIFGSIGYWMHQQGVARGGQPWYYFFLIIPLYDLLILVFSLAGTIFFGAKGLGWLLRRLRREEDEEPAWSEPAPGATSGWNVGQAVPFASMSSFLPLFTIFWTTGVWGAYTYASEKMPWLMIHIVQPATFIAALFLGAVITAMFRARQERIAAAGLDDEARPVPTGRRGTKAAVAAWTPQYPWERWNRPDSLVPFFSFLSLFVLLCVLWAINIDWQVRRALPPGADESARYNTWGMMMLLFILMLVVLLIAYGLWVGPRRVARWVAVGVVAVLSVYAVRSTVQLSYYNPDVPTEMAVYVQTSPDVVRVVDEINRLSVQLTGRKEMGVIYDSLTSWPMEWYFRDYTNKSFQSGGPTTEPPSNIKVMTLDVAWADRDVEWKDEWEVTKYPMRWWFPEETYKPDPNNLNQGFVPSRWDQNPISQVMGALDTIRYTITTPEQTGKLWKYLIYREPYAPLGSTDMSLWVRKDVAALYHGLKDLQGVPDYDYMSR